MTTTTTPPTEIKMTTTQNLLNTPNNKSALGGILIPIALVIIVLMAAFFIADGAPSDEQSIARNSVNIQIKLSHSLSDMLSILVLNENAESLTYNSTYANLARPVLSSDIDTLAAICRYGQSQQEASIDSNSSKALHTLNDKCASIAPLVVLNTLKYTHVKEMYDALYAAVHSPEAKQQQDLEAAAYEKKLEVRNREFWNTLSK